MKIYLYDFFNSRISGERWIGEGNVPAKVPVWLREIPEDLNEFFPKIECNIWNSGDFIGGIKAFNSEFCVFRIFNGGMDFRGRSNRWVMLAVVGERNEFCATNLWEALNCDVFCSYAQKVVPANAVLPEGFPRWNRHCPVENPTIPRNETCVGLSAKAFAEKCSLALTSTEKVNGCVLVGNVDGNVRTRVNSTQVSPIPRKSTSQAKHVCEIPSPKKEMPKPHLKHQPTPPLNKKKRYCKFACLFIFVAFVLVLTLFVLLRRCALTFWDSTEIRFSVCKKTNALLVNRNFPKQEEKDVFDVCPQCGESHEWIRVSDVVEVKNPHIEKKEED